MTLPAESQVGRRASARRAARRGRWMAAHDRIRLTGQLRKSPPRRGFLVGGLAVPAGRLLAPSIANGRAAVHNWRRTRTQDSHLGRSSMSTTTQYLLDN